MKGQKEEGLRLYCARQQGRGVRVRRRFHEDGEAGFELIETLSSQAADGDGRDSMPPPGRHGSPIRRVFLSTTQILFNLVHL